MARESPTHRENLPTSRMDPEQSTEGVTKNVYAAFASFSCVKLLIVFNRGEFSGHVIVSSVFFGPVVPKIRRFIL